MEGTGKSMKNAVWQKEFLGLKQHRTVKIRSIALAIVELHLSEGIRQLVSQYKIP